jgi:hypothetical protein
VPLKEKTYNDEVRWRADEDLGVAFLTGQEPILVPSKENLGAGVEEAEVIALHDISRS